MSEQALKELRQIRGILGKMHGEIIGLVENKRSEAEHHQEDLFSVGRDIMDNPTKFTPRQEKWVNETITGLTTRIEELQGSVRRRDTVIKQANEELKDARELIASHGSDRDELVWLRRRSDELAEARYQPNLVRTMKQKQMERMENVCRLATAARKHLKAGNLALAEQLLTPLATGNHDTYPEKENWNVEEVFGNSNEARTRQQGTDTRRGTPYIFDESEQEDWFRR